MKRGSTILLRTTVTFAGLSVLALCIFALPAGIREEGPHGYGPIFMGMYITAVPFFIALYETMKLLGYVDKNTAFSELSVEALKHIKICALIVGLLYMAGMPYIYLMADYDDAPGVIVLGLVIIFASLVIAGFAAVLQKLLKSAIDIKSENDLTV